MNQERQQQVQAYQDTDSSIVDYARFEGDDVYRAEMKSAFLEEREYHPKYDYPKLDGLIDDEKLRNKKTSVYEAVLELEAAKSEPDANLAEIKIYRSYHDQRLKKIMLVEAAQNLRKAASSGEYEVAKFTFSEMNKEVYGEYSAETFQGMIATEQERLHHFEPQGENATAIKAKLSETLGVIDTNDEREKPLMDKEVLAKLHAIILKRFARELAAIPDTDDSVYYDADACAEIMNNVMKANGHAEAGWQAVVEPKKTAPATNVAKSRIFLPTTTRRNARQLGRLTVHEDGDHVQRGINGDASGFIPLKKGTADYADVEEGLGVLFECALDNTLENPAFDRARDRYITAGLALGADGKPRDARQVYETLWRTIAVRRAEDGHISDDVVNDAKNQAYGHVENAFRGTEFWMQGVIYTKLKVYYEGLKKNADFFTEHADNMEQALEMAMIGKYNHTDPEEMGNILAVIEARKA